MATHELLFFFFYMSLFREGCWGFKLLELFVCGRRMTFGGGGTSQGAPSRFIRPAVDAARPLENTECLSFTRVPRDTIINMHGILDMLSCVEPGIARGCNRSPGDLDADALDETCSLRAVQGGSPTSGAGQLFAARMNLLFWRVASFV
jgi:hypothetical protein